MRYTRKRASEIDTVGRDIQEQVTVCLEVGVGVGGQGRPERWKHDSLERGSSATCQTSTPLDAPLPVICHNERNVSALYV